MIVSMPAERRSALLSIASALWRTGWRFEGNKGEPPSFESLNERNQRRWFGAALACEHLMSQAKQDAVQQSVVINACIAQLEAFRDANARVHIKGDET